MIINKYLKEKMYSAGGYRERYAMDHNELTRSKRKDTVGVVGEMF